MTARERFVEATNKLINYMTTGEGLDPADPVWRHEREYLSGQVEAFADAVCNCPDSDCGGAESKFYETEHKECRAALLKECGLGK